MCSHFNAPAIEISSGGVASFTVSCSSEIGFMMLHPNCRCVGLITSQVASAYSKPGGCLWNSSSSSIGDSPRPEPLPLPFRDPSGKGPQVYTFRFKNSVILNGGCRSEGFAAAFFLRP